MIFEVKGDLLAIKSGIIAHQVNRRGVMGAGIARQIRKNLLTDEQYGHYQNMCRKHGKTLLGKCFIYPVESRLDLYVAKPVRGKYTDWQNAGYGLPGAQKLLHGTGTEDRKTPCVYTRIHRMRSCRRELGLCIQEDHPAPVLGFPPSGAISYIPWTAYGSYGVSSGDVPMNLETETLEEHWHCFPAGTIPGKNLGMV